MTNKCPEAECRSRSQPAIQILAPVEQPLGPISRVPTRILEPVQDSGLQIGFQSFTYLGRHRIVLVRTTADYAALFRESSNSSQSLVNPSITILNAYGIFTGLSTDTTYLRVTN